MISRINQKCQLRKSPIPYVTKTVISVKKVRMNFPSSVQYSVIICTDIRSLFYHAPYFPSIRVSLRPRALCTYWLRRDVLTFSVNKRSPAHLNFLTCIVVCDHILSQFYPDLFFIIPIFSLLCLIPKPFYGQLKVWKLRFIFSIYALVSSHLLDGAHNLFKRCCSWRRKEEQYEQSF